jgi:hypothetical protein
MQAVQVHIISEAEEKWFISAPSPTNHSGLCKDIAHLTPSFSEQKIDPPVLEKVHNLSQALIQQGAFLNFEYPKENLALSKEKLFYEKVKLIAKPLTGDMELKSNIHSFNHVNEYIIDRGILWFKARNSPKEEWKPIYFEGEAEGIVPEEIRADGANLMVLARNKIYYKKVLEESPNIQKYIYKDISSDSHWIPQWFTLPVISLLQNPFADNHLTLPNNYRAWSISHRGEFCCQIEDGLGNEHLNPLTITSLYVLLKDGKNIEIFDPYANIDAHVILSVFETPQTSFEAISLTSSASTLFIIGYEITPLDSGGVKRILKTMTWLVDHDTLGYNPAISYGLGHVVPRPEAFMLPMPGWIEHPLELKGRAAITKEMTIFQTGQGNNARELRIAGWNEAGEAGYYRKKISDTSWQYVAYPHSLQKNEALEPFKIALKESFKTTVSDYEKGILNGPKLPKEIKVKAALLNFGLASLTSTLRIENNGKIADLLLFKTKGIMNFIFPDRPPIYQLALPPKQGLEPAMEKLLGLIFGENPVMDLTVNEDKEKISIQPGSFFTGADFEFIFSKR